MRKGEKSVTKNYSFSDMCRGHLTPQCKGEALPSLQCIQKPQKRRNL